MTRQEQKQQTRNNIVSTAERLFRSQGFDQISTRQIAKECGIAVGTVFAHFPDINALTQAIYHQKLTHRLAILFESLAEDSDGLTRFLAYAKTLYELYDEDRAFSKFLLKSAMFDLSYFQQQMDEFLLQIAEKLEANMPRNNHEQRYIVAKSFFGFYMFNLLRGLEDTQTSPNDWLALLEIDCRQLLTI
ncbi:TetR/AcrR family transcriptional regulator [Alginatibacterium sediminis]|nr:TetR/AcrR family transcriptional regulator [Alginatibacterium sediminis]